MKNSLTILLTIFTFIIIGFVIGVQYSLNKLVWFIVVTIIGLLIFLFEHKIFKKRELLKEVNLGMIDNISWIIYIAVIYLILNIHITKFDQNKQTLDEIERKNNINNREYEKNIK